jgi:adenosylcobinamide kinase/adenosylcobinamide-phosphate guanylyltransferase
MAKILVIGGTRSGKSDFAQSSAESYIKDGEKGIYLATSVASDPEMTDRIRLHREKRGEKWLTIEEPLEIVSVFQKNIYSPVVLLDCITLWLNNLFFYSQNNFDAKISDFISFLLKTEANIIMVTNELGMGIAPDNEIARKFRDSAGLLNQDIAKICDGVYFVVAGLPLKIK